MYFEVSTEFIRDWATRTMSSELPQRLFHLKLDPLTGNSEWVIIDEEVTLNGSQTQMLATTSYLDMLNDSYRNKAFREAIDKTITGPCHVLDIGAGTGLLSLMAARAMSSVQSAESSGLFGKVTACESYLPMVKLMKKVLHHNGLGWNIKVINKRSDELKVGVDISSRADILVSEILDSELLGEGLIPTLQHAHDNLLVENPKTVPHKATIYGQFVESDFLWKLHDLYSNEEKTIDGIHLVPDELNPALCITPRQYAMHCDAISKEIQLLSEPFKIFEFDFWKRPESHGEVEILVKATSSGKVHAIVSWWILQLDHEGTIVYSTAPRWARFPIKTTGPASWCDHWKQCVWFIPGKGVSTFNNEEVHFRAVHSETSISFHLKNQLPRISDVDCGLSAGNYKHMLSLERIAIYGDREWRLAMLTVLSSAGKVHPLSIVADDSVFLTLLIASLSKLGRIISLFPGLRDKGSRYLQDIADANAIAIDQVKVLQKKETILTIDDTYGEKADLFIGEPFYCGNDGALPWQNLRFWKERSMLNAVLSDNVVIIPRKGILRACAMSLPDLWNSRRCLSKVEGFDHSNVNTTLGACGELPGTRDGPLLPFYIWQCGEYQELSEIFTVMEFDFSKPIFACNGKAQIKVGKSGICHGFGLWIDWVMDSDNSIVISTGPDKRYWKQGVKLLAKPVQCGIHDSGGSCVELEASLDPFSGELTVRSAFS